MIFYMKNDGAAGREGFWGSAGVAIDFDANSERGKRTSQREKRRKMKTRRHKKKLREGTELKLPLKLNAYRRPKLLTPERK